jgi:hypothetical protein
MAAAVSGSFAVVIRSQPDFLENQVERLDFCRAVAGSGIFEGNLPLWMVEAAIQGAAGSPAAIQGIPSELLVETQIFSLKEMSERYSDSINFPHFIEDALHLAYEILPTLSG